MPVGELLQEEEPVVSGGGCRARDLVQNQGDMDLLVPENEMPPTSTGERRRRRAAVQ